MQDARGVGLAVAHQHVVADVDIRQGAELQPDRLRAPNGNGGARGEAEGLACSKPKSCVRVSNWRGARRAYRGEPGLGSRSRVMHVAVRRAWGGMQYGRAKL